MNPAYLIVLSVIGFAVSFYIFYSKKYDQPMHCIMGRNCDEVVKSRYGKTFGIENTIPGMAYYVLVFVYGILLLLNRNVFKVNIIYYFIVIASIGSVLFSAYLAAVQAFVLKKWCEYCIVSSVASVLILVVLLII
ncbi:vitamin K epoxide reductase family protein [Candidatus Woesearchaeota archaeon]|nr:vitamin K epoxide reductase family protein [Candidatus Woesearchaeota archaeon]